MTDLIKPKEFKIVDSEGKEHTYWLSNFPAVLGREVIVKYPMSSLPKIGDYAMSEEIMIKLMGHVAVDVNGQMIRLETKALINNHCPDFEVLGKLEMAMMEKNYAFFRDGRSLDFLENLLQIFLTKTSEMLTRLSEQSSTPEKPASMN